MTDKSKPSSPKNAPPSFESALRELEKITLQLEQGEVPLEEVAALYERGTTLVEYCRQRLAAVRGKIQKLEKQNLVSIDDVGD